MNSTFIIAFKKNIVYILIILSGLLFRLVNINQPILEYFPERQTQTAEITRNIYANGWPDFWTPKIRYVGNTPTPLVLEFPLYNGLVSVLYTVFGPNVIFGRIVSLFSFIIASIVFVLLLKKTVKPQYIFPSLLFFIFSPVHVLTSRSFQPDEMALALLLVSFYNSSLFVLMFAGLVKAPYYLIGSVLLFKNNVLSFKRLLIYFLFFLPVLLWAIRASELMSQNIYAGNYSLSNWFDLSLFINPGWYLSLFQIEQINVFTTLGILFFMIGLFKGWKLEKMYFWKLLLMAAILYGMIFNRHIVSHDYYSLIFIPPISVFIGIGLSYVFAIFNSERKLISRCAKVLVVSLFFLGLLVPSIEKINRPITINSYPSLMQRYKELIDVEK